MALSSRVSDVLRIAGVGLRGNIRNPCKIDVLPEGGVIVPKDVAPLLLISIGVFSSPPTCIPVQPVSRDHIGIQNEIVNQASHIIDRLDILVVGRVGHVLCGDKRHKRRPLIGCPTVEFIPSSSPSLDEIHLTLTLVVIIICEVQIIDFLSHIIDPPVLAIDIEHARFMGTFIHSQVSNLT